MHSRVLLCYCNLGPNKAEEVKSEGGDHHGSNCTCKVFMGKCIHKIEAEAKKEKIVGIADVEHD